MNRGLVIAAVVLAASAILAVGGFTRGFGLFPPKASNELALNGNVDIRQVDLGFRVGGRIASIPVEEGARVKAGDVLATLDLRPVNDQLAAEAAQVAVATAQLEKQRNGNRPQDIAQAAAQLSAQRAALVKAKADYDRRSALVATGAVSRADFDATKSQYEAAQAQVRAAEEALSLQRAGARREDIQAAVAQRAQAMAQREQDPHRHRRQHAARTQRRRHSDARARARRHRPGGRNGRNADDRSADAHTRLCR